MVEQPQLFDDQVIGNGQRGGGNETAGSNEVERGHPPRKAHPRIGVRGRYAQDPVDRKSTRLNSSHDQISYAVFCLKKKKGRKHRTKSTQHYTVWSIP